MSKKNALASLRSRPLLTAGSSPESDTLKRRSLSPHPSPEPLEVPKGLLRTNSSEPREKKEDNHINTLILNRKARNSQKINLVPQQTSDSIRKVINLTGKKPGQKITIRFKPIRSYAPEELRAILTDSQQERYAGEIILVEGNISLRFCPKINGLYIADVIVKSTKKSILVKPLEIVIKGIEIDITSSDLMIEISKKKEEKRRKKLIMLEGKRLNPEDSIEIITTTEDVSTTTTRMQILNNVRYRLPPTVYWPERTTVRTENNPPVIGTVSFNKNSRTIDFPIAQIPPYPSDILLNIPDEKSPMKAPPSLCTIKQYPEILGTIGQEIRYPLNPIYTYMTLPANPNLSDFVVVVKGPRKTLNETNYQVVGEIKKNEKNNQLEVVFTPWVKGLYKIIVRYFSELYLFAAVPVKDGMIMKQIIVDKVFQSTENNFHFTYPPITTQRGKKISYSLIDILVVYMEQNSPKKFLGDINLGNDGSLYVHIKPKQPGFYKAQIYLWDIPILTNEIQFVWQTIGEFSPRTEILIKDLNLLETEVSRALRHLKINLSYKTAQFLQIDIFCEVCSTKIQKILSYQSLPWNQIILQNTTDLRTLFITIIKLQISLINLYTHNLALIENIKQLENILEKLSNFGKLCTQLIKVMTLTLETKRDQRAAAIPGLGSQFLQIFEQMNELLTPLEEMMKIYTKENAQTLIITQIDLRKGENFSTTGDFRNQIFKFLESEEEDKISDSLICSPHRMPNNFKEAVELFQRNYRQLLSLLEQEGIDKIVLVSNLCKTILVLEKIVLEKWIKFENEETFFQTLWKEFKEKLILIIGDYLENNSIGDFGELDKLKDEIISLLETNYKPDLI